MLCASLADLNLAARIPSYVESNWFSRLKGIDIRHLSNICFDCPSILWCAAEIDGDTYSARTAFQSKGRRTRKRRKSEGPTRSRFFER
jgi:hypothetical protein